MAFKDVFKGFFTYDEEEVYVEEAKSETPYKKQAPKETTQQSKVVRKENFQKQSKPTVKVNEEKVTKANVVNMHNDTVNVSSKVCLFEPRVFSDTQDIADELKNRRATLVNLQRIDKISAKRIIDFLSGTVYAIGGDIQRIGQDIFLCTPDNVEVAGSITEMLDAPEEEGIE
ncbi:cell division protein SepF [Macrococcus armenti]|uniref:Cell division protein SepF n=1 Tax=Macrococcus armenti TaxID=2875764 RepID=A0ABY3ZXN1_9STAP|nr:cell division protein SepF [Macrococcus armenti]UBH13960.1 cell division protein SepF [Macrococcus armenti]UOB21322.1 cell division protein SepF [Macrococcus armenti]